jgi:hypothetical protein
MSNRFLNHLKVQLIKSNPHLAEYFNKVENLTSEDINDAITIVRKNNTSILLAQFAKSFGKKLLIAGKDAISKYEKLAIISNVINPENITPTLSEEEYLAILDNAKNSNILPSNPHPVLLILKNMLVDTLADNINSIIQNQLSNKKIETNQNITSAIEKIFKENIVYNTTPSVDDDDDEQPPSPKRQRLSEETNFSPPRVTTPPPQTDENDTDEEEPPMFSFDEYAQNINQESPANFTPFVDDIFNS